ncbi:hypothetical protein D3C87_1524670 [compost metagenome]
MLEHQLHIGAALVLDFGLALFDHRQCFFVVAAVQQRFDASGDLRCRRRQPRVDAGFRRFQQIGQGVPAAFGRNGVQGGARGVRVGSAAASHRLGKGGSSRRAGKGQGEQGDKKTRLDRHVGIR